MTAQVMELLPPRTITFQGTYKILSVEGRKCIGGYANIEVRDSQGETIIADAWKTALPKFMADKMYRNVHVMHSNVEVGKVIESVVDSEGHLWETKVDDLGLFVVCEVDRQIMEAERVWAAIESGELSMFSIAGEVIHRSGEMGEIIDQIELHEITICVKGANPGARFMIIKAIPATDVPSCTVCGISKTLERPTIFTRQADGKRFVIYPSQARKGEIGHSEAVSVLEQRTSEKKESDTTLGEDKTGTNTGIPGAPLGAPAGQGGTPAPDGAEKLDAKKLLEIYAEIQKSNELTAKMLGLFEEVLKPEKSSDEDELGAAAGKNGEATPQGAGQPTAPVALTADEQAIDRLAKMVADRIVKVHLPEKRSLVTSIGVPGGVQKSPFEVSDEEFRKETWPEMEARLRAAKKAAMGGGMFQ